MKRGRILQDLMLGLIYPAVLGTVMYSALQAMADPLVVFLGFAANNPPGVSDPLLNVKMCLLLVTIFFYCFDYMYIKFTRNFDWPFFLCDVIFLVTLYVTVSAIGIGRQYPPQVLAILRCYTVFMAVYLAWDGYEYWRCTKGDEIVGERHFYRGVLVWEIVSLAGLGLGLWLLNGSLVSTWIVLGMTAIITSCFGYFAWRKREFMVTQGAPNTAAQPDGYAAG